LAAKVWHESRVHLIASLPSLIHCSAVPRWVVEGDDPLGRPGQVGRDKPDRWVKLARVPFEAERIGYTIRLPTNGVLQRRIGYLLKRPVGRPPREVRRYYASFTYQAQSWNRPRRVVANGLAKAASPRK
jgi:hypothetical protein